MLGSVARLRTDDPATLPAADVPRALAVAGAALLLYLATLQPGFGGPEDTPKFQFLGHVLGTAHPPGYPLYVLLSHVFVKIPVGTIAYRANLFSAVLAACGSALVYVIGRRMGAGWIPAAGAALGMAAGASYWRSAVFAEVYSLAAVRPARPLRCCSAGRRPVESAACSPPWRRLRSVLATI